MWGRAITVFTLLQRTFVASNPVTRMFTRTIITTTMSLSAWLGVSEPKKSQTPAEKLEKKREYEHNKRKRTFLHSWLVEFPWLEYTDERMHCKLCTAADPTGHGSFITGSRVYKIDSLKAHETSEFHIKTQAIKSAQSAEIGTSAAEVAVGALKTSVFNKMSHLFRTAHYLAKKARPYSDFADLCKLDMAKGLDIGDFYQNRTQCKNFIGYIANVEKQRLKATVSRAPFMSIITDGTTDSSIQEAEALLVRTSYKGDIRVNFMAVVTVTKPDADHISKALMQKAEERLGDEFKKKLIGTGTDGASVMLGKKGGTVALIKNALKRPFIIAVHCSGHRLELAFKDAMKKIPAFGKIDALLLSVFYFYHNSPLNRSNLKESAKSLGRLLLIKI